MASVAPDDLVAAREDDVLELTRSQKTKLPQLTEDQAGHPRGHAAYPVRWPCPAATECRFGVARNRLSCRPA